MYIPVKRWNEETRKPPAEVTPSVTTPDFISVRDVPAVWSLDTLQLEESTETP